MVGVGGTKGEKRKRERGRERGGRERERPYLPPSPLLLSLPLSPVQKYLMEFRVLELKELLKQVNLSTRGRKCDLFQRANDLLSRGSPKIQLHIRDIYLKYHCSKRHSPVKLGKMSASLPYSHMKDMMQHHTPKSHHFGRGGAGSVGGSSGGGGGGAKNGEGSYILHPDVTFKALPFFTLIETIIRPTTLGA